MPCYQPQNAYKAIDGRVTFVRKDAISNLQLPCQSCIGCRLERSRQWGVRIMNEAQLYQDNMFITLTYDDDHLPIDESINVNHFQTFMKKYRNSLNTRVYNLHTGRNNNITLIKDRIRFFHCGEYGEDDRRPHYHAIIFNHQFGDLTKWKENLFLSEKLKSIWQNGFISIGNVTIERAQYVAKYIIKKITGKHAQEHYSHITRYGEEVSLTPEYITMSRRPGIGSRCYDKYQDDIFPSNFITFKGVKMSAPKYYSNKLKEDNPHEYEKLIRRKKLEFKKRIKDNTPARLLVREQCAKARIQKREL